MNVALKLFYAGAITALLILLVAFGIRTFYAPPKEPPYPQVPVGKLQPRTIPPSEQAPPPTAEEQAYLEAQERFQTDFQDYLKKRARYRRNVLIVASAAGVLAVAAGLAVPPALDAVRLGLVVGGLGTIIYAVAQAGEDLDEAGPEVVFGVALVGLALMLAAGYRWLAPRGADG